MQLGELQNQLARFDRRGVSVIALSVDEPTASVAMIERLGLTFDLGSDPGQQVIGAFRVQNPDTSELAIHAVYIVDTSGVVFYRKVGLRRPVSQELIDAIDAFRGEYPRTDEAIEPRQQIPVAFPQNEFQALLTATAVDALPGDIDPRAFEQIIELIRAQRSDDALIAFRSLMVSSSAATEQALYDSAAWLTRRLFFADNTAAIDAGQLLSWRLGRIRELEAALATEPDPDEKDELLHTLARARAGLSMTRAEISRHSADWRLRSAKTTLRSYREVARAQTRLREAF